MHAMLPLKASIIQPDSREVALVAEPAQELDVGAAADERVVLDGQAADLGEVADHGRRGHGEPVVPEVEGLGAEAVAEDGLVPAGDQVRSKTKESDRIAEMSRDIIIHFFHILKTC